MSAGRTLVGELRHDDGLWREFVPVAWHVNYWDRLGWPDKFADQAYTDRQYAYSTKWKARTVYTPGLVRAGEEWRVRDGDMLAAGSMIGGELTVVVAGESMAVTFQPPVGARLPADLQVNVALLGGGIESDVRSGENRGQKLAHEFVVLQWDQAALPAGNTSLPIPISDLDVEVPGRAMAVWVSSASDPTPLQATGGWLDNR